MPIIPKFSSQTYAKLGHEVIEELIEWVNSVYDHKREMAELRSTVQEILVELRALPLKLITRCGPRP